MNNLYILPFDHRHTFTKALFGEVTELTPEQFQKIKSVKQIIYLGFKKAIKLGVPKEFAAILVDDEFGDEILKDAKANGFITCLTTEKSGQDEFAFQHGADFATYINRYQPDYVKVLVRYNPEGDIASNARQQQSLKVLSDFCKANNYKFLLELLVSGTYDASSQARLISESIKQLIDAGVEPHVWKLEGMNTVEDYAGVVDVAQSGGRDDVGIIVLGHGDNAEHVKHWLEVGSKVKGIIGFAVGRTVFLDVVTSNLTDSDKINTIAERFYGLYKIFTNK